jgi:hypothetical protein
MSKVSPFFISFLFLSFTIRVIDKNRKDIKRGIPLTYNKLPSSDRQKQEGYKEGVYL